jgi:hypothetical protein
MCACLISPRFALRLLCGTFLAMALFDVPVAVSPEAGRVVGVVVLLVLLAGIAALALRRRAPQGAADHGRVPERKDSLLLVRTR